MAVKAKTAKTDDLVARAKRYFKLKELGKKYYAQADELAAKIAHEIEPGEAIDLGEKGKAVLVDNHAKAKGNEKYPNPTIWVMAGARQWELEMRR